MIKHAKISLAADDGDPSKVQGSDWNSDHVVDGLALTNNASPSVGPEMDYVGYNGNWSSGVDVANSPSSRDFVVTALRQNYSLNDGATTSGSPTLTSASEGGFTSALAGASISGAGIPAGTTILAVGDTTSLTMSSNATVTATGVRVTITTGATQDLAYWRHRGALSPTLGIGVTPPDGSARLQISPQDTEPTMGGVRIRVGPSQTANALAIHDSGGTDRLWIDKDFYLTGSNPEQIAAVAIAAKNDANGAALVLTDVTKTVAYSLALPTGAGNILRVSCQSGGKICFDIGTDGSFMHQSTNLAFYGATPVARQTIVPLTDNTGGTANDTLQAIPDPADSPATADALRDDIVSNVLPSIRNDLADLAAKVNAIRTALVNLGLLQ